MTLWAAKGAATVTPLLQPPRGADLPGLSLFPEAFMALQRSEILARKALALTRYRCNVCGTRSVPPSSLAREGLHHLNRDPGVTFRRRPRPDPDADVHVEDVQESLESIHAETGQLAAREVGDVRLCGPEQACRLDLRESSLPNGPSDHPCQLGFRETLVRVAEAQVVEDVAAAFVDPVVLAHFD